MTKKEEGLGEVGSARGNSLGLEKETELRMPKQCRTNWCCLRAQRPSERCFHWHPRGGALGTERTSFIKAAYVPHAAESENHQMSGDREGLDNGDASSEHRRLKIRVYSTGAV